MKKTVILLLIIFSCTCQAEMFTGMVESSQTQVVNMPQVRGWQAKISEMTEEGTFVEPGDFLVRIDGSELDSTIESKTEQLDVFKASAKRDMIQIQIDLNNAKLAHEKAQVARKVAQLKADVPVDFIGELEYKERQLTLKKSIKTLDESKNELAAIEQKQREKKIEIELGTEQKEKDLAYWKNQLDSMTIHANQSGYVIYASHPWTGSKYQTGDQANSGMEILKVSKKQNMKVKAWVNAIDIPNIAEGKKVSVSFDALPNAQVDGQITSVSSGGRDKKDWGDGLYYEVEIGLNDADNIPLLPGMSALIILSEG
ncbi:HlyD family secretion protein [Marinicella litoralis]|uniref:HlyD family secretion protein n=1 Tax=Marinicella litoralis TaxID=644220 RepID=A0A4R6XUY6_9GAMM|nr:HlyD family efflux transporter periplasmic adaptor subunit [Marinicella litoralis]TDR23822.1 HlyD family secretion protein [Marinicella litoralis]